MDGVDATGEATADSLSDTILTPDAELNLGSRQNGANHNFRGRLYEASVWNSALSPENIAHIYLHGVIQPVPSIRLSGAGLTPSGTFAFQWNSIPGRTYRVESAPDLSQWTPLAQSYPTGGATGATTSFSDNAAPAGQRFYRVRVNP